MKEKEVNQDSRTKNSCNTSEESGEESRDDEAVELIFMGHLCTPNLSEEAGNQCPEYD